MFTYFTHRVVFPTFHRQLGWENIFFKDSEDMENIQKSFIFYCNNNVTIVLAIITSYIFFKLFE